MEIPSTNILQGITQILKEEGFIKGYRVVTEKNTSRLRIALKNDPGNGIRHQGDSPDESAGTAPSTSGRTTSRR